MKKEFTLEDLPDWLILKGYNLIFEQDIPNYESYTEKQKENLAKKLILNRCNDLLKQGIIDTNFHPSRLIK